MKSERTKAVLFMVLTFMVGIVIGVFIPGVILRFQTSDTPPPIDMRNSPPQDRFERMLFRTFNPDSLQKEKIRPLAHQTSALIDTIQSKANKEIRVVIDSLKLNLKPILTPEQQKLLEDFGNRPRGFGGPGGPGGGRGPRPGDPNGPPNGQRGGFPERPPAGSAI